MGIKLLSQGFIQAYIDFFYLTHETTPDGVRPGAALLKEISMNRRKIGRLDQSPEMLTQLSNSLVDAEQYWREGDSKKSFKTYVAVAQIYEHLDNYGTAAYFHHRCLEIALEFKYLEGQALAFKGLGICEERVLNHFEAMSRLETALERAVEGMLDSVARDISRDLVRVYQQIALDYLNANDFDLSLTFFEKCLDVARRANDKDKEAECYQQIARIHEKVSPDDLTPAIEYLQKFLELGIASNNKEK